MSTFKTKLTYECSEKLFELPLINMPREICELVEAWKIYNEGISNGWPSSEASEKASNAVDLLVKNLVPYVSIEVDSQWLDEPEIMLPLQGVFGVTPENLGFDITQSGLLRVWCHLDIDVDFVEEIDPDNFDEWSIDNHLTDLFMLNVSTNEYGAESISEESSVYLRVD